MSDAPAEQRGESSVRRPPSLARVGRWMQGLVQGSAILATAGYFSLRAHFNYLGVSSIGPIDAESYLRECAYMAYGLVDRIAVPAVFLLGSWALLGAIGQLLLRRSARGYALEDLRGWLSGILAHGVTGRVLLIYLVAIYLYAIAESPALGDDAVAVGPLDEGRLRGFDPMYFDVVYYSCIMALWLCYRATRGPATSSVWSLAWIVSLLLCIQVPQLFGRIIHERSYHEIRVSSRDGAVTTCGLLVSNAGGNLLVWRAREGIGEFLSIPAAQAQLTLYGKPFDLLKVAQEAARDRLSTLPRCGP